MDDDYRWLDELVEAAGDLDGVDATGEKLLDDFYVPWGGGQVGQPAALEVEPAGAMPGEGPSPDIAKGHEAHAEQEEVLAGLKGHTKAELAPESAEGDCLEAVG